jgi:hypothetical protein
MNIVLYVLGYIVIWILSFFVFVRLDKYLYKDSFFVLLFWPVSAPLMLIQWIGFQIEDKIK